MLRKIFAIMLVIACAFAVMPKFTHAAAQNDIAFEPQANVVVGSQTRTGRISYSLQFNIGRAATLIEIAPAGTGAWAALPQEGSDTCRRREPHRWVLSAK
jgi:hypothetical protein